MATSLPPPWHQSAAEMRVLLAPHSLQSSSGQFIPLLHPKSKTPTSYFLAPHSQSLHELHYFKQPYTSWFLNDYVLESGALYLLTPIDPVFLLLPVLHKAKTVNKQNAAVFRSLDETLFVPDFPGYQLLTPLAENSVHVVCEVKEIGEGSKFYRLDDGKVLTWLVCKANQLKATLPGLDRHYRSREERDVLGDAVLIIAEYLEERWVRLLCERLGLSYEELTAAPAPAPVVKDGSVEVVGGSGEGGVNAIQAKSVGEKKGGKGAGRGAKKAKVETGSQNIGDMFRRVTRRG